MAQANIRAVITAEDRASKTLGGFSDSVHGLSSKIASSAKVATAALVAATTAAITFGVKSAAEFQQTRVGIENMLGSVEDARSLLSDISKFAAETPFEFPELAQATRQLIAFGFSADDAFDTMKQLGDVSAAIGAPINDIAYLMGTLRVQGRAFMIDIRQFAQRGIPIYEYLSQVLGKTTEQISDMIEEGKIGFPEVQQAFKAMTDEGGKFHNTMAKQSQTLNGRISTLKDSFGILLRNLVGINEQGDVTAGGVFDRISRAVEGLNGFLSRNKEEIIAVGEAFKMYIGDMAGVAVEKLVVAWEYLGMAWQWIKPQLDGLWKVIEENLWPALQKLWEAIKPLAPYIFGALVGAITMLVVGLTYLTKTFSMVIEIVAGTIEAFKSYTLWVTQLGATIYTRLVSAISTLVGWFNTLKNTVLEVWNFLKNLDWGQVVGNIGTSVGNSIVKTVKSGLSSTPLGTVKGLLGFASGGYTGAGAANAVAGVVHKGEYVLPRNAVDQSTGLPKSDGGGSMNITIQAGAFMGSQQDARRFAEHIMNAYKDLQGSRMQTV